MNCTAACVGTKPGHLSSVYEFYTYGYTLHFEVCRLVALSESPQVCTVAPHSSTTLNFACLLKLFAGTHQLQKVVTLASLTRDSHTHQALMPLSKHNH